MMATKAHLIEGLGIGFVAEKYMTQELKEKKLVTLPGFKMENEKSLVFRNDKYETPTIKAFKKDFLKFCQKKQY